MVIYPDTSFLVSLYIDEDHSKSSEDYADTLHDPLVFTPFHRLEFRTAIRVRVFRNELTISQMTHILHQIDEDLLDGLLRHTPLSWAETLREAERLGAAHLTVTGVRSGDLLHISSAVVLGAREFVTFDQRQTKLARRAGLKVKALRLS